MENLEKLFTFLEENEGKKMDIGIHLTVCGIYNTLEGWTLRDGNTSTSIMCNGQEYEFLHNELEGIETDPELMHVYPDDGDFEIYTDGSTICFKIHK